MRKRSKRSCPNTALKLKETDLETSGRRSTWPALWGAAGHRCLKPPYYRRPNFSITISHSTITAPGRRTTLSKSISSSEAHKISLAGRRNGMLIIDDILSFPLSGALWIVREVHNAAQQEMVSETRTITAELMDLHMLLETGKITEAQ